MFILCSYSISGILVVVVIFFFASATATVAIAVVAFCIGIVAVQFYCCFWYDFYC